MVLICCCACLGQPAPAVQRSPIAVADVPSADHTSQNATGSSEDVGGDQFAQRDQPTGDDPADRQRQLVVDKRFLHLPIKNGAEKRRMWFEVDGEKVREFEIELADEKPDFWVFSDVARWRGKRLTLRVDRLPPGGQGLRQIIQSNEVPGADQLYGEKYRPQFHFTSRRGWNNDPNGLVLYKGEYHLFYQHNPYGTQWGNMHWGHAISRDLVHWQELPTAIYPKTFGDWAFSGSALVDWRNTSGLKTGDQDVIVLFYTSTARGECLAYSKDGGRTFSEYAGNPVVQHQGRDPKVIWYAPGNHWVMAVYDELENRQYIAFYSSADLKQWTFQSRIEGYYECPEIFPLAVDGDPNQTKWVLHAADGNYATGQFDGQTFTPDAGKHRFSYGNCFYASQTFSDISPEDARRIQIGWGRVNILGMPFNQMMLFPCELTLRTTEVGIRMFANPVGEIERLYDTKHAWTELTLKEGENLLSGVSGELVDIRAELKPAGAREFGFHVRGIPIVYDVTKKELTCEKHTAPLSLEEGRIRLRLLVDRTSIEIFANQGRVYMPIGVIPPDENRTFEVFTRAGDTYVNRLDVHQLRSAWK